MQQCLENNGGMLEPRRLGSVDCIQSNHFLRERDDLDALAWKADTCNHVDQSP
jgi:hypothetical protein